MIEIPPTLLNFAGFSLEKRSEWKERGPWRCRVIPNKSERQEHRIEAYGATAQEAIDNAALAQRQYAKL